MPKHVFNVAAAALCLLCATATARQLTQTSSPPSSPADCAFYIIATDTRTGAESHRCALATLGVSYTSCQAAGQAGKESTLYDNKTQICSVPIPYDCDDLSVVSGRVSLCSSTVGDSILDLNKQANDANFYATALNTNGNTLSAGGTLRSASGSVVTKGNSPAPAPQSQSGGATPASPASTASTPPPAGNSGTGTGGTLLSG